MNDSSTSGSLLGWLGRRASRPEGSKKGLEATGENALQLARRVLLEEISTFMLAHQLEVSSANLLTVHSAFSGVNPSLARKIAKRISSGSAVTQIWLDEVAGVRQKEDQHDGISDLAAKLETMLASIANSTGAARTATSEYSEHLEGQVAELSQGHEPEHIISNIADLATAMLERTRQLESDMQRREGEVELLQQKLEKARHDADVDHLTGLPNRRAFEAVLEREHRAARAAIEPLAIAFCDIDHFKRVNDTHGHETGDRVIRLIAETLAKICDDKCHVARHGGEEFVMLFRGLPLADVKGQLDHVREQLSQRRLVNRKTDLPIGQITFSAGVADVFDFDDPRCALKAADDALYAAKEAGRNQVIIADACKKR